MNHQRNNKPLFGVNNTIYRDSKRSRHSRYLSIILIALVAVLAYKHWPHKKPQPVLEQKPLDIPQIAIPQLTTDTQTHNSMQIDQYGFVETIKSGDTLSTILNRHSVSSNTVATIMDLKEKTKPLDHLALGHEIKVQTDAQHHLKKLVYNLEMTKNLVVQQTPQGLKAHNEAISIETRETFRAATVYSSLFTTGTHAGIPQKIIYELVESFKWDIDFAQDIRPGDQLSVLYEEFYHGDKKVGTGHILATTFINQGKTYSLMRFTLPTGETGFYTLDGHSVKQRFLRAPVEYTRISSQFDPFRFHPILNRIRAHQGTDYAAPKGTPIHTTANGKIAFEGRKGGYGNAVIVDHGGNYTTLYGHMSAFSHHFKVGSRVKQGDVIGFVGSTGLATANHVHYEFRINGKHYDPVKVKLPRQTPIPHKYYPQFAALVKKRFDALSLYKNAELASHSRQSKQHDVLT